MKPLLWFRLYAEIVDDVKLLTLAPSDRWFYVGILACKAQGLLDGEDASRRFSHVQIKLRLTEMELEEAARRLAEAGLIDEGSLQPLKWEKRQFRSDHDDRSSAERVRSWREKRRNQTVTAVTPPPVTRLKPRTETETETETDKDLGSNYVTTLSESVDSDVQQPVNGKKSYRVPDCPYQALVDAYHELLPACPRVEVLSEQRKRHMQARWRQVCADEHLDRSAGLQWFRDFYEHVGKSAFLTGKVRPQEGRKPFFASLDWLMGAEKFVKVYEGAYHR